jgi:hypothetical protein
MEDNLAEMTAIRDRLFAGSSNRFPSRISMVHGGRSGCVITPSFGSTSSRVRE